jgi:hypothetical protein
LMQTSSTCEMRFCSRPRNSQSHAGGAAIQPRALVAC